MLTIQEIVKRLQDRRLYYVARQTGVNYNTIRRIASGECANPKAQTIQRISDYLEGNK